MISHIYQDSPKTKSTFTEFKNRSYTDSLESYNNGAWKELMILKENLRIPNWEFIWHLLVPYEREDLKFYRDKVFRYLREHGIIATANIEITRDKNNMPSDCVHFHVLTKDKRSEKELRDLFNTACVNSGLGQKEFRIDLRQLSDGLSYFSYFVKYKNDKVILFQKGTGIRKFYTIGKWYKKSKKELWSDYIRKTYPYQTKVVYV